MGRIVKSFFGGADAPKASTASQEELTEDKDKAKKQRRTILETEGGAAGEELAAGGVSQRNTLLGN